MGSHDLQSAERFKGAKEYATGNAIGLTGDVQALMHAVDEVDIRMAGRAEEYGVTRGSACGGVGSGVVLPEISLGFDNAAYKRSAAFDSYQQLAQELFGDQVWSWEKKRR